MALTLSKSANQFAVELFHTYLKRHGEKYRNLLLCPYLIYHSLAMMLAGSEGETGRQLARMLRLPNEYASHAGSKTSKSTSSAASVKCPTDRSSLRASKAAMARNNDDNCSSNKTLTTNEPIIDDQPIQGAADQRFKGQSLRAKISSLVRANSAGLNKLERFSTDELRHRPFLMMTEQLLHANHDFVHLASFIYLDKAFKRVERYKSILRDYYETKPKKIDFSDIETMTKTVNEDVARTTENIYSDILSKQEAEKMEKSMFLVSAVFFRGFWLSHFTEVNDNGQFYKHPNNLNIKMMSKVDYLKMYKDSQLEARVLMMPFEASDLQMLLILPNDRQSDSTYLCSKISAQRLDQIFNEINKTKFRTTRVTMPVFCVDSGKISIQSTLVQMGASDLFDSSKANMSGISEDKPLWLNKILHRCFIICDNRGAITSSAFEKARRRQAKLLSGMSSLSRGQLEEFTFDHPFMYIIMDSVTSTILLMGLYTDPTETLEVVHESQLNPEEAHNILTEGVYKT